MENKFTATQMSKKLKSGYKPIDFWNAFTLKPRESFEMEKLIHLKYRQDLRKAKKIRLLAEKVEVFYKKLGFKSIGGGWLSTDRHELNVFNVAFEILENKNTLFSNFYTLKTEVLRGK